MWSVWLAGQLCECKFGMALCGMPRSLVLRDIGVLRNGILPGGADSRVAPNWQFRSPNTCQLLLLILGQLSSPLRKLLSKLRPGEFEKLFRVK